MRLESLGHYLGETRTARDGLTWELFRVKGTAAMTSVWAV